MGGPSSSGKKRSNSTSTLFKSANNDEEANELGYEATPLSQFDDISIEERNALSAYTNASYYEMNGFLRGELDTVSNNIKQKINDAKNALEKTKLEADIIVYRGSDYSSLGNNFNPTNYKKMKGAIIQDKGFMSTSLLKEVAHDFHDSVTYEIRAKKGTKAAFVKYLSAIKGENEVVFTSGTKLKVADIIQKSNGEYHVIADVI